MGPGAALLADPPRGWEAWVTSCKVDLLEADEMLVLSSMLCGPSVPSDDHVFLPFYLCPPDRVRVVWVTAEPLFGVSMRNPSKPRSQGLGPGTERTEVPSQALQAILQDEGRWPQPHGDVRAWAYQGVLFLSLALTAPMGQRGHSVRHEAFWAGIVKRLCEWIQQKSDPVFVCFGERAAGVRAYVSGRARVLELPDPLERSYPGTHVFQRINDLLPTPLSFEF